MNKTNFNYKCFFSLQDIFVGLELIEEVVNIHKYISLLLFQKYFFT